MIRRLTELGTEIWSLASTLANDRLDTEGAALEPDREQLEGEKREALELADQLSAELVALQGRAADVEALEQAARRELEATRTQLGSMNECAALRLSGARTICAQIL